MNQSPKSHKDFNTATENDLIRALQITPRLARRIISMRPFGSFEQVNQVWGIDEKTLQKIRESFDLPMAAPPPAMQPELSLTAESGESDAPVDDEQRQAPMVTGQAVQIKMAEQVSPAPAPIPMIKTPWQVSAILAVILLIGAVFRFSGLNWDNNFHQHPDERFLSMVAESIRGVDGIGAYFDTQNSTLNPLRHGSYTYGMFPLFVVRMVAEWVDMTAYNSVTIVGRFLSGLFDLAAVWLLFILAKRLFNHKVALVAAALAAVAVLPIQLSHYFTVDSFSTVFVLASFYFLYSAIPLDVPDSKVNSDNYINFGLFGLSVGLAAACKVNTLPVLGMIFLAAAIYLFLIRKQPKFIPALGTILFGLFLSGLVAFLAFRIFQPYAFAGPGFTDLKLNQRWYNVIREVTDQVAGKSEWPPNHHWTKRPVQYAWVNMVQWGMGIPLGLSAWFGLIWAGIRIWKGDWRKFLFPFVWVAGYFLWQNMQFWRYMRYFIPIYPFLILFAAWALVEIFSKNQAGWQRVKEIGRDFRTQRLELRNNWRGLFSVLLLAAVLLGTAAYAFAFTRIYARPHTRVQASHWILENIQGPFNVVVENDSGSRFYPIPVFENHTLEQDKAAIMDLRLKSSGSSSSITAPQIKRVAGNFFFHITRDEAGEDHVTSGNLILADETEQESLTQNFGDVTLLSGETYYLRYRLSSNNFISFSEVNLRNEIVEEPFYTLNLRFDQQEPGLNEGLLEITPQEDLRINRLTVNHFSQTFAPSTAVIKVSLLKDRDEETPLAVSEQRLEFTQPGKSVETTFQYPSVDLNVNNSYQVKYELIEGQVVQVLAEDFALETSWDDALPLSVDGVDALGGIYSPMNLELYETDHEQKREAMIKILDQVEYLVIPSNRAYDSMPRLELRYPLSLRYYQLLFDCDCSGDDLEQRAYQLEPPFHSPLGFDLVATFVSHPNFGPIRINDQNADESFTVYDHPKVFVFKKSADFSIEKIKEQFNKIDLEEVVFQAPMNYSKAPTALALPEERLEAQTNGGTWSEMFNRLSMINQSPFAAVVLWYLMLALMGWIVFPLTFKLFPGLPDRGYSLVRMVALLILAWMPWVLGSLKILPFTRWTILLCLLLLLALNLFAYRRNSQALMNFVKTNYRHIIATEVIFLVLFAFGLMVRIGNPDLWHPWLGGEKPMDFSFFNGVIKSVYFPPQNPWFSGHYINYYYYGYVVAAVPTKLLGIMPSIAFNLVLPSWFAMTGIGVFGVTRNLYCSFGQKSSQEREEDHSRIPSRKIRLPKIASETRLAYISALFALVAVLIAGNFYQVKILWQRLPEVADIVSENVTVSRLESVLSGASRVLSGEAELPGDNGQWYFAASRPILHDMPDTPIAEFPYFSFLYADLHPHLLTMPFYALALSWYLSVLVDPIHRKKWRHRILSVFMAALFIGSFRALHTWDFPTFVGLGVLSLVWMVIRTDMLDLKQKMQSGVLYSAAFVGLAMLMYAPFTQWFKTEYVGIELWKGLRTPLNDYFVVFGLSLFIMFTLLVIELKDDIKPLYARWSGRKSNQSLIPLAILAAIGYVMFLLWKSDYQVIAFGVPLMLLWVYIIFFKKNVTPYHRLIWLLFAMGYGLTYIVEVLVLKGDVGRSNMVFRWYLEAWFILGITMSVAALEIVRISRKWTSPARIAWMAALQVLVLMALLYPLTATGKKIADRWPAVENPPKTLDGALFMLGDSLYDPAQPAAIYSDEGRMIDLGLDYAGIQYMQDHVQGSPVIVEGHTAEYRFGARYAIHTGLPSVIGWNWHTRQHNSLLDGLVFDRRIDQVVDFYNTTDFAEARKFIERYQVKYIIVSGLERVYYDAEGLNKFAEMARQGDLRMVFGDATANTATIYEVLR